MLCFGRHGNQWWTRVHGWKTAWILRTIIWQFKSRESWKPWINGHFSNAYYLSYWLGNGFWGVMVLLAIGAASFAMGLMVCWAGCVMILVLGMEIVRVTVLVSGVSVNRNSIYWGASAYSNVGATSYQCLLTKYSKWPVTEFHLCQWITLLELLWRGNHSRYRKYNSSQHIPIPSPDEYWGKEISK